MSFTKIVHKNCPNNYPKKYPKIWTIRIVHKDGQLSFTKNYPKYYPKFPKNYPKNCPEIQDKSGAVQHRENCPKSHIHSPFQDFNIHSMT